MSEDRVEEDQYVLYKIPFLLVETNLTFTYFNTVIGNASK